MASITAVSINDDLAAGQAGITLRAADNKTTGGVDVILGVFIQQFGGDDGFDDMLHHIGMQLFLTDGRAVLAGNNNSIHAHGFAVIVFYGNLALAIRAQIIHHAILTHFGQALGQLVGQADGQRHQLGGFVAGITEHHTLVASTGNIIVGAKGNVGALAVNVGDHAAGIAVKTVLGAVITNLADDLACNTGNINIAVGRDFAHDVDKTGGAGGLAGNAGTRVLFQDGIQNGIRNLVADFVGMAFGNGFGCEQNFGHKKLPP